MIELTSGITCANLATLRPLFKSVFPSLGGTSPSENSVPKLPSGLSGSGGNRAGDKSLTAGSGGWSVLGDAASRSTKAPGRGSVEEVEMQTETWRVHGKDSQDFILGK